MEEGKSATLSWRAGLGIFFGSVLIASLFFFSGKGELARPTIYSIVVIIAVVAMRWQFRNQLWFWLTIAILVSLHIPLILFVPWGTRWVPALIAIPVCLADLAVMLGIMRIVELWMGEADTTSN